MNENYIIQHMLDKMFLRFHEEIAIDFGDKQISYVKLRNISNAAAEYLSGQFKKSKSNVGILLSDRVNYIQIVIALLRCGYTVVPLYPGYPAQRLMAMIASAELEYIVVDDDNKGVLLDPKMCPSIEVIVNEKDIPAAGGYDTSDVKLEGFFNEDDPAYIHFTSGTTGKPKAILGRNKGLGHYMTWLYSTFNIGVGSRVPQFSIQGFDPFMKEMIGTLLNGGTICVPEDMRILKDAYELKAWLNNACITHVHCVSSLFRLLNNATLYSVDFVNLKYILLAGEKIEPADLKKWYRIFDDRVTLVNCYGPTETTFSKLFYIIKKEDVNLSRIPVGKPMSGTQALIMDENLKLCDPMIAGEIYIRTPYRSLGYYNDSEMTNEKFIRNPFSDDNGDLIYKSGDVGRYLPDGNVEILGRVDRQIKINGFRVELEEIEGTIEEAYAGIKESVVISIEKNSTTHLLYAFISLREGADKEEAVIKVKEQIAKKMPSYVYISALYILDEIPRNDRLKIDYDTLKKYKPGANVGFTAPETSMQKHLANIWHRILGVESISIDDSFMQLGGNSLSIMSLVSEIYNETKVRVPLGAILQNDTIRKQEVIIKGLPKAVVSIDSIKLHRQEECDLSYPQEGIWFLSKLSSQSAYNIPFKIEIKGYFDIAAAEKAINRIVKRHSALRSVFYEDNGIPKQKIINSSYIKIESIDLKDYPYAERLQRVDSIIEGEVFKKFDLQGTALFSCFVFHIEHNRYLLFMNFYHLIFDGYSMNIFAEEFARFYNSCLNGSDCADDDENIVQYCDYVLNERNKMLNGYFESSMNYWKRQLEGPIKPIRFNWATDIPDEITNEADYLQFIVEASLHEKILTASQIHACTPYMILLAVFFALLYKLSYLDDIVIGMPVNGRVEEEYKSVIGFFVNTIPVRVSLSKTETFRDLFHEVRERCIEGYENYYPFDKLISELKPLRSADGIPIISTVFLFHDNPVKVELENLEIDIKEFLVKNAKHDIKLDMQMSGGFLSGRFEYRKHRFERRIVEGLRDKYLELLNYACENGERKIEEIFGMGIDDPNGTVV